EEKSSVTTPGKVHFLGFRFKLQSNNRVAVLLSAKTKAKLLAKIQELTPRSWGQSLRNCFEKINEYYRGWVGHFRICTEEGASEFRRYDAHLQRRLRAIIIHQKKRARFLYRHLLQRGLTLDKLPAPPTVGGASGIAVTARGSMWRTRIRGSLPSGLHPMTSGALRTLQQKSRTSLVWRCESTIQRAGCEARKSGSVRGAAGRPAVPTRQRQPKRAPCLDSRRDLIPRSWPKPSVVRFPWSTRSVFSKRPMLPPPLRVESEHYFAGRVCIPRTW